MKLKPQSPEGYPVFQQGYVKKAGQHFNDKWSKKYAMLHGNKISIADDETGKFHQHITLTKNSFLMLFNDPKVAISGLVRQLLYMYSFHFNLNVQELNGQKMLF